MRGYLRIRAQRAPYRRAGLEFGEDRQIEVPASSLDPAQLRLLDGDASLQIYAFSAERGYVPLPIPRAGSDEELGTFLAKIAEGASAPSAGAEDAGSAAILLTDQLRAAEEDLKAAQLDLANTNTERDELREKVEELTEALRKANEEAGELGQRIEERDRAAEDLRQLLAGRDDTITGLRAELEAAKKAGKPAKPNKSEE